MAEFCTSCGAPLGQGMQFCTSCGAGKGAAPPAAAAAASAPKPGITATAPAASLQPTVPAQAPKSGSPVVKIILIVVAIIVLIGILSAASCVYFMYRARRAVRQFQSQVQALPRTSEPGFPSMHPVLPNQPAPPAGAFVDTGAPTYPGAVPFGGGSLASGPNASIKTQEFTTSDSVQQVTDYYKDKLGPNTQVMQAEGKSVVTNASAGAQTTIAVKPDSGDGKTHITIMVIAGK